MIFNNFKKVKVGYYNKSSNIVPTFMFNEISKNVGCPATKSLKDRLYGIKGLVNVDIDFGIDEFNNPYYNYEYDIKKFHESDNVHNLINDMLSVMIVNNKCVLQIMSYTLLVTDDKDLEITLLEPLKKTYKNCEFISGAFKPYGWVRNLNASYMQTSSKEASVRLNVNQDMFRILTNKPISLKQIEPTKKIIKYESNIYNIVGYFKKLNSKYPDILKKRPNKLL